MKIQAVMGKYVEEMKIEYDTKLGEFDEVYKRSTEKISAMEQEYNDEQFVNSTLQN